MNKVFILTIMVFSLAAFKSNAISINEYGEEEQLSFSDSKNKYSAYADNKVKDDGSDYNEETHETFGVYSKKSC